MEIRRLGPSDLESYFENRLRALQDTPSAFSTTYAETVARGSAHYAKTLALEGDDKVIFGAIDDGQVVGTIAIFKEDQPKLAHKAGIYGMFVDRDQRKTGIGAALLDKAIQHARDQLQVAALYLSVESKNLSAKRLYISRGFKIWGTEPRAMKADGQFFDEDHMVLLLE